MSTSIELIIRTKPGIRCFKRMELLMSACLTIVLASFTIIYTVQQDFIAKANRDQEQRTAQMFHEQQVYDDYINDISRHLVLLRKLPRQMNEGWEQLKQHIRMKTLGALPQVNLKQRQNILFFLYDNALIRSDSPSDSINLSGADFSGSQFADHRCYLVNLSLREVIADRIEFHQCNLEYADFSGSQMAHAKFIGCRIGLTRFIETNLTGAVFENSNIGGLRLHNAILVRSHFTNEPYNTIFMNTDLFQSSWKKELILNYTFNQRFNRVSNTRFSDGTFSQIDSTQLVLDHSAELGVSSSDCSSQREFSLARFFVFQCEQSIDTHLYHEPRPGWRQDTLYTTVTLVNATDNDLKVRPVTGECYFRCPLNKSELEQAIDVKNYSLIINSNQTWFNLSAFFSCPFKIGQAYLEIGFYTDQLISANDRGPQKLIFDGSQNDPNRFHFFRRTGHVPMNTRIIYIAVGADRSASDPSKYCLVDEIALNLFEKRSSNPDGMTST